MRPSCALALRPSLVTDAPSEETETRVQGRPTGQLILSTTLTVP